WVGTDQDHSIHVGDTLTGKEAHCLKELPGKRRRLDFSPDGRMLVGTSDDGPGQIWDVATGQPILALPYGRQHWLISAAFTPDSKSVILAFIDHALLLVDVATVRELWSQPRRWVCSTPERYAFTPDGKTLFACACSS